MGKIIVHFMAGLGNQMFQYAMYKNLEERLGKDRVGANIACIEHNGYELEKIFNIKLQIPNVANLIEIRERQTGFSFHEEYFNLPIENNYILNGLFQNEKYLSNVEDKLRIDFTFSKTLYNEFSEIIKKLQEKNSVAIHLRRGDFHQANLDNCPITFYEDAIRRILEIIPNPQFFIFSDDMGFAKEKFSYLEDKFFIEGNNDENSYKDLFLMSQCKNFIIAPNSTFSFWGAWLSANKEKTVLMADTLLTYSKWEKWGIDFPVRKEIKYTRKVMGGGVNIYQYYTPCMTKRDLAKNI